MKRILFNSTSFFLTILFVFGFTLRSCNKQEAPELPPVSSMVMDFSDFQSDDQSAKKSTEATYDNWSHAVGNVFAWNLITAFTMAVPVTVYSAMLDQTPVYLGNNEWQWNAVTTFGNSSYTGKLIGKRISNEEFTMEMYITAAGIINYTDFLWFEGTVRYDHTHGLWTLNYNPDEPVELMSAEWNKDFETEAFNMKYTYLTSDSTEAGNWIEYDYNPANTDYNSSYTISGSDNTINIEWNNINKNGRIKDPVFYSDEQWYYWNELLQDYIPE